MRWRCLWGMVLAGAALANAAERTTPEGVARGARLFAAECAGCHGTQGDGKGVADPTLMPRPRDLTSGKFKLRSTSPATPMTNGELLATITNGIPGTAMPAFRFLDGEERRALVEYVASLAKLPAEEPVAALVIPPEPPVSAKLLEQGKGLYADLGCPACHGDEGRGDGAAAPYLKDEWGSTTLPRNLVTEPMKGGETNRDLYLRFSLGMPGTPMPSYAETTSPEDLWALVFYVASLRAAPPPTAVDLAAEGKALVAARHCAACHTGTTAEKGRGGAVGPPLDVAARILDLDWMASFLAAPRAAGKIYPAHAYRMPDLDLTKGQAKAITAYLAGLVARPLTASAVPTPNANAVARGAVLFRSECGVCHRLGTEAATAPTDRQGPSLTDAAKRFDYAGVLAFVTDPGPNMAMKPSTLSEADRRAVLDYIWERR